MFRYHLFSDVVKVTHGQASAVLSAYLVLLVCDGALVATAWKIMHLVDWRLANLHLPDLTPYFRKNRSKVDFESNELFLLVGLIIPSWCNP